MLTRAARRTTKRALCRRRHAIRLVPGIGRRSAVAQRRPLRQGGRGRCREARGRRTDGLACRAPSSTPASRSWATSASRRRRRPARRLKAQGRTASDGPPAARRRDRRSRQAGCFSLVLEAVPARVAAPRQRGADDPDDRDRRRAGLRRPGARLARPARASTRASTPALREALRRRCRRDPARPGRLRRRRARSGAYPERRARVQDQRRGATRLRGRDVAEVIAGDDWI